MLVPGKPFQPSLMFVGKARSLPGVEHLNGASLSLAVALFAKIRISWNGLPRADTLAYYKHS